MSKVARPTGAELPASGQLPAPPKTRTDGGHFTATATLGVDFDANTAAASARPANKSGVLVSGTITDFVTGNVGRPDWRVSLIDDANDMKPPTSTGRCATSRPHWGQLRS